jgi:preprotein translocase subunit SecE
VTTLEGKTEKRGLFSIYKRGQGKWVRWGTVTAMAISVSVGVVWLETDPQLGLAVTSDLVKVIAGAVWVLFWAGVTFWLVNNAKMAEFLIATESEMRKVTWPSRREVVNSTKVIILLTFLLGVLLALVDLGFMDLFSRMGLS